MNLPAIRHAGLLAIRLAGWWHGALIEGPSGVGKSDLALRAMAQGFRLVADDRTLVFVSGGRLFGRAPRPLAGLIEVRGLGVVAATTLRFAEIGLVARCRAEGPIERLPGPQSEDMLGLKIAALTLNPLEAAAPEKLRRALEHLGEHRQQGYQAPPWLGRGG